MGCFVQSLDGYHHRIIGSTPNVGWWNRRSDTVWVIVGRCIGDIGRVTGVNLFDSRKEVRASVPVHAYSAAVCLFTALFLFALVGHKIFDVTSDVFISPWVVLAMALGPQLFGHVGLTWCLERIQASTVALGLLLEPVGAALLAWWWFSETPTFAETIGAGVILIGLLVAMRSGSSDLVE